MTTFAVFYNDEDAATIAGNLTRSDLTLAEKTKAQKFWNGGMKNWATSPFGLSPCADPVVAPPDSSRRCVVTVSNLGLGDLADLLNAIGTRLGTTAGGYLTTLAIDVRECSVEPWV